MRSMRVLGCAVATVTLVACFDLSGGVSADEVSRVTDPSGSLDAVLIEYNGGATTSFGYGVFVVARGDTVAPTMRAVASLDAAVRNQTASGANLRWNGSGELAVEYLSARHDTLRDSLITVRARTVRTLLLPGIQDPRAPSGGMAYNLQGAPR